MKAPRVVKIIAHPRFSQKKLYFKWSGGSTVERPHNKFASEQCTDFAARFTATSCRKSFIFWHNAVETFDNLLSV